MLYDVDALLFDLDGTLVEPSIDFAEMQRAVLAVVCAFGEEPPAGGRLPSLETIAVVRARLGAERGEAFARAAQEAIVAVEVAAAQRTRPYPGADGMLALLAEQGYRVGIVTRNCRAAVEALLARHPLRHKVLLTRDDIAHVKPDPRHLLTALAHLGALPGRALMCGDHPMDIRAGQAAAIRTVGVVPPGTSIEPLRRAGPDLLLMDVAALPDHIQRGPKPTVL